MVCALPLLMFCIVGAYPLINAKPIDRVLSKAYIWSVTFTVR